MLQHLCVSQPDLRRVEEAVAQCFSAEKLQSLCISVQGHIYPVVLYFQKVTWLRQRCVLVTCVEQGDPHSQFYRAITQGQQVQMLSGMAELIQGSNHDVVRTAMQMVQLCSMYAPISMYP